MDQLEVGSQDGSVVFSVRDLKRRVSIKVQPKMILELAVSLTCCPGCKKSTAHATWHFNNPRMPRPCDLSEHHVWH